MGRDRRHRIRGPERRGFYYFLFLFCVGVLCSRACAREGKYDIVFTRSNRFVTLVKKSTECGYTHAANMAHPAHRFENQLRWWLDRCMGNRSPIDTNSTAYRVYWCLVDNIKHGGSGLSRAQLAADAGVTPGGPLAAVIRRLAYDSIVTSDGGDVHLTPDHETRAVIRHVDR